MTSFGHEADKCCGPWVNLGVLEPCLPIGVARHLLVKAAEPRSGLETKRQT